MVREGTPIGAIAALRQQVRPFTDKQIALLQTFADQAVIAIENVRLFQELQARTHDLTQSLEETGALSEVILALSGSSLVDLREVLDTVARRAMTLSGSDGCGIFEYSATRRVFDAVVAGPQRAVSRRHRRDASGRGPRHHRPGGGNGAAVQIFDVEEARG